MAGKLALLAGASGLIGKNVVELLLQGAEYQKVTIFVRRPLGVSHPKLEEVVINFGKLPKYKKYFHVDDVFCCLGTTIKKAETQQAFKKVDVDYPLEMGMLAKEMQARNFLIISSMGADPESKFFYNRMKGQVEVGLKEMGLNTLCVLRPSLLLGARNEVRLGEKIGGLFARLFSVMMIGHLKKYKPVEAKDVALTMYKIAQREEKDSFIYLSDEISEIAKNDY